MRKILKMNKKAQTDLIIRVIGAGIGSVGLYLVAIGKNVWGGVLVGTGAIIMALGGLAK